MTTELTPEQQQFVDSQIASGLFTDGNEVVEAALYLLHERQSEYTQLRTAIDQDRHGKQMELDIDDVKSRGRKRLDRE